MIKSCLKYFIGFCAGIALTSAGNMYYTDNQSMTIVVEERCQVNGVEYKF